MSSFVHARIIPRASSPIWPLPADYDSLTVEGQRQARVNACRMWASPDCPRSLAPEAYDAAVELFDRHYLWPDADDDFNPYFYDDDPFETPAMHRIVRRQWATWPLFICVGPRGSAKTSNIRKSTLMELLAVPANGFVYATSSADNAESTSQVIKEQLSDNRRISDDWRLEMPGGAIVPARGAMPWGVEFFKMRNGSWLQAISAESRQRGKRPRQYVLDDPEYDPRASTSMTVLRSYMERLIMKIVLPMVMRSGCGVRWLATFVSKRHYCWSAMTTIRGADGVERALDPRFDSWARMILRAEWTDAHGVQRSCWPEMWPLTDADAAASPRRGVVSLETIRRRVGPAVYLSEYMGQPGDASTAFFGDLTERDHGWTLVDPDDRSESAPASSAASIRWHGKDGEPITMPLQEFLARRVHLFMTVDTSWTAGADSDLKVCTLMGYDPVDTTLFVLDTWGAQCQEPRLHERVFSMAEAWRCPSVWPETVRNSFGLYKALQSIALQRTTELTGSFVPRIMPLRVGMTEKNAKIAALQYRFVHGLVKLPLFRRMQGCWRLLFEQIEQFNPEVESGGLAHDDFIDTVAMSMFVVRGRLERPVDPGAAPPSIDVAKALADPHRAAAGLGVPQGTVVPFGMVGVDAVMAAARGPQEGRAHGGTRA